MKASGNKRPQDALLLETRSSWRRTRERPYILGLANRLCRCGLRNRRRENSRAAINERHVEITPHEREALDAAVQKLGTLKVQHVELIEPTAPTGDTIPPS
jgi:hypothetical protein